MPPDADMIDPLLSDHVFEHETVFCGNWGGRLYVGGMVHPKPPDVHIAGLQLQSFSCDVYTNVACDITWIVSPEYCLM